MAPDSGRQGAFTSTEDMLNTMHTMAVTLGIISTKLDTVIEESQKKEEEINDLRKEVEGLKAKLYTISGIIGIAVSVATNWIVGQVNS